GRNRWLLVPLFVPERYLCRYLCRADDRLTLRSPPPPHGFRVETRPKKVEIHTEVLHPEQGVQPGTQVAAKKTLTEPPPARAGAARQGVPRRRPAATPSGPGSTSSWLASCAPLPAWSPAPTRRPRPSAS